MMKILAIFTVLIALLLNCNGQNYSPQFDKLATIPYIPILTNNGISFSASAGTLTNVNFTNTFKAASAHYHTFHEIVNSQGTNTITMTIYSSIDGKDWIPFSTNTATIATSNVLNQVQITGEQPYFQEIANIGSSNGTVNIFYAGF